MLEVEEADSELLACYGCERPENHCGVYPVTHGYVPTVTQQHQQFLRVYRRMKAYGALPETGGLHDQVEIEMRVLDKIHETVELFERERLKKRKQDLEERRKGEPYVKTKSGEIQPLRSRTR